MQPLSKKMVLQIRIVILLLAVTGSAYGQLECSFEGQQESGSKYVILKPNEYNNRFGIYSRMDFRMQERFLKFPSTSSVSMVSVFPTF